jgi:predicted Zn finger-like uncharacterized protein
MYTYCPNCFVVFQITTEHIDKAGGQVRCSECRQVYRAVDYLFEDLATTRSVAESQRADAGQPEVVTEQHVPADAPEPGDSWKLAADEGVTVALPANGWQHRTVSRGDIGSGVVVGLLLLLLGVQWVYFNRDRLAADDIWRSGMERFCEVLQCELPMRVDVARIGIIERDVRKHPAADDALLINVTFENRAEFNQPYPLFVVSFSDKAGDPVAMRRFSPSEYLDEDVNLERGIPPQLPVRAVLEVVDPGTDAVSYQFGFL